MLYQFGEAKPQLNSSKIANKKRFVLLFCTLKLRCEKLLSHAAEQNSMFDFDEIKQEYEDALEKAASNKSKGEKAKPGGGTPW